LRHSKPNGKTAWKMQQYWKGCIPEQEWPADTSPSPCRSTLRSIPGAKPTMSGSKPLSAWVSGRSTARWESLRGRPTRRSCQPVRGRRRGFRRRSRRPGGCSLPPRAPPALDTIGPLRTRVALDTIAVPDGPRRECDAGPYRSLSASPSRSRHDISGSGAPRRPARPVASVGGWRTAGASRRVLPALFAIRGGAGRDGSQRR